MRPRTNGSFGLGDAVRARSDAVRRAWMSSRLTTRECSPVSTASGPSPDGVPPRRAVFRVPHLEIARVSNGRSGVLTLDWMTRAGSKWMHSDVCSTRQIDKDDGSFHRTSDVYFAKPFKKLLIIV
jgi:hypothetical protein